MDWDNSHLHDFEIAGQRYGEVEAASNEDEFAVAQLARKRSKFRYTYDFGDTWIHDISVKEIVPPEPGIQYPWCVGGARCAPPEDSGGPYAYERYLSDLDPEEEFDPEAFSVDAVNRNLHPEPKKRKPRKRNT